MDKEILKRALRQSPDSEEDLDKLASKVIKDLNVNVITVEAYRSGAVGEVSSMLKLIKQNRAEITIDRIEKVLKERLKQLK